LDPRIELTALLAEVGAGSDLRSRAVDRQSVAEVFSDWMRTEPVDMGNTVRRGISRYDGKRVENPSGYIAETLRAVFQSLFATDGFEDALVDVVNRGGDTDHHGCHPGNDRGRPLRLWGHTQALADRLGSGDHRGLRGAGGLPGMPLPIGRRGLEACAAPLIRSLPPFATASSGGECLGSGRLLDCGTRGLRIGDSPAEQGVVEPIKLLVRLARPDLHPLALHEAEATFPIVARRPEAQVPVIHLAHGRWPPAGRPDSL